MKNNYYYICDACGNLVTIADTAIPEGETWVCDVCGSNALWEFTDKANAAAHSEHIRRVEKSGLFRKTRP